MYRSSVNRFGVTWPANGGLARKRRRVGYYDNEISMCVVCESVQHCRLIATLPYRKWFKLQVFQTLLQLLSYVVSSLMSIFVWIDSAIINWFVRHERENANNNVLLLCFFFRVVHTFLFGNSNDLNISKKLDHAHITWFYKSIELAVIKYTTSHSAHIFFFYFLNNLPH